MIRKIVMLLLVFVSQDFFAQMKMKWISGDFDLLKNEMSVRLLFDFDSSTYGRFPNEAEFMEHMRHRMNKKDGSGREWAVEWVAAKKEIYEPRFSLLFFKHANMVDEVDLAKYTMVFITRKTEPGASVGWNIPACIDGELWLYKTDEPDTILGRLAITKVLGEQTYIYNPTIKLGEAYAIAGRTLGRYIRTVKKG